ncbi:MAG: UpxY family transcription antiterminator [Alistipes sp.]|nr:UpxY family transcription antiterminator [Alistipes sp.]
MLEGAEKTWFAMRATYGRNLMAQRALEMGEIESFVPMRKRTVKVGRRVKTDMIPVVRDLIFVLGERDAVQEAKSRIPYLHYIVRPSEGKNIPVEVPEEQMNAFIAVCKEMDDNVELLSGEEVHFEVGEKVEVTNGSFRGHQGLLVKIEGKRSKRFVVAIDGVVAAVVSGITANDIKHI